MNQKSSQYLKVRINSQELFSVAYDQATDIFMAALDKPELRIISHLNLYNDYIMKNKATLSSNCLFFLEGIGLKWILFIKTRKWLKDINGSDLIDYLTALLASSGKGIYLLGSTERNISIAAERCISEYNWNIAGFSHGYFDEDEAEEVALRINDSGAEILILGLGMAKEWRFLEKNSNKLRCKLVWNVGGLFDLLSLSKKRAPNIIRKIRLEWLYRLTQEPVKKGYRNLVVPPLQLIRYIFKVKVLIKI